jgi:DNA-binding transcriptional ArsR family regulator
LAEGPSPRLRAVHKALADPLRIRLFELVAAQPRSAKELAGLVGMRPDRLYHHLAQLEEGGLIEISGYRELPGGKVERVYSPAAAEPPGDDATPADVARLLSAALETTRADVNAAALAQEAGEQRRIGLGRMVLRLNEQHLTEIQDRINELLFAAQEHPDEDGVWTTVLWAVADREDRRSVAGHPGPGQAREGDGPEGDGQGGAR